MRIATIVLALFALAAIGGFALWPGLITAIEEFVVLSTFNAFGLGETGELAISFMSAAAVGGLAFIIAFLAVRRLIYGP